MKTILSFIITIVAATSIAAQEPIVVNLENAKVKKYLEETNYKYLDASRIATYTGGYAAVRPEYEHPNGINITLDAPAGANAVVTVVNTADDNERYEQAIAEGETETTVWNTKPKQEYTYEVTENGAVVQSGTIITEGHLRMIKMPTMHNVRDMGGWTTKDGTGMSQYGLLFRGSEPKGSANNASEEDLQYMRNVLGIRAELDLRNLSEPYPTQSPLGEDIDYKFIYMEDKSDGFFPLYDAEMAEAFRFVLDCLKQRKPVYVHCTYGADRTGTFCGMIHSLTGMPVNTVYQDYELSSFSRYVGSLRYKNSINKRLLTPIGYLQNYDLRTVMRNYMIQNMDISQQDIDDMTAIMLGTYDYPDVPTGIVDVKPASHSSGAYHNVFGHRINPSHWRGIAIRDGRKIRLD